MSITLFRNIADELTELEKETIVPLLIDALAEKTADNTVTSLNLSRWLKACGYNISEIRVRKMISYIVGLNIKKGRECDLGDKVVIGCGKGYFVTRDVQVVQEQIESLLDRKSNLEFRIDSLLAQKQNLQRKLTA